MLSKRHSAWLCWNNGRMQAFWADVFVSVRLGCLQWGIDLAAVDGRNRSIYSLLLYANVWLMCGVSCVSINYNSQYGRVGSHGGCSDNCSPHSRAGFPIIWLQRHCPPFSGKFLRQGLPSCWRHPRHGPHGPPFSENLLCRDQVFPVEASLSGMCGIECMHICTHSDASNIQAKTIICKCIVIIKLD
jgi:hypothetical protein